MKRHTTAPAIFAMVVVAFLFGLAPVFHAVCVSALSHGSTSMTHVMADGTVMNMSAEVPATPMNMDMATTSAATQSQALSGVDEANILGHIMITAGLTLLTFFGLRFYKHAIARGGGIELPQPAHQASVGISRIRARPPSPVDLNALCISRT